MSLVIAAISKRPRSALHNASISAVLPEPTGPPTPTRRGPCGLVIALLHRHLEVNGKSRDSKDAGPGGCPPISGLLEIGLSGAQVGNDRLAVRRSARTSGGGDES